MLDVLAIQDYIALVAGYNLIVAFKVVGFELLVEGTFRHFGRNERIMIFLDRVRYAQSYGADLRIFGLIKFVVVSKRVNVN